LTETADSSSAAPGNEAGDATRDGLLAYEPTCISPEVWAASGVSSVQLVLDGRPSAPSDAMALCRSLVELVAFSRPAEGSVSPAAGGCSFAACNAGLWDFLRSLTGRAGMSRGALVGMVRLRLAVEVLSGITGRSAARVVFTRSGNVITARDDSGLLAPMRLNLILMHELADLLGRETNARRPRGHLHAEFRALALGSGNCQHMCVQVPRISARPRRKRCTTSQ
jgi:hypothetical protein